MRVVCQGHSTPSCGGHCSYREENPGPGKDGSESQAAVGAGGRGGGVREDGGVTTLATSARPRGSRAP
jgi:hypothetical protein